MKHHFIKSSWMVLIGLLCCAEPNWAADPAPTPVSGRAVDKNVLTALGVLIFFGGVLGGAWFLLPDRKPGTKTEENVDPFVAIIPPQSRRQQLTFSLIAINTLLYIATILAGQTNVDSQEIPKLFAWGADFAPWTIGRHQWYRILTCTFLHAGIMHLFSNMWCLLDLGRWTESLLGSGRFIVVYLVCGIAASLVSLWWNPAVISIGASGAVFGLAGFLSAVLWKRHDQSHKAALKTMRWSLSVFVLDNTLRGMQNVGIDNAAHVGGLLTGLLIGMVMKRPTLAPSSPRFDTP